MRNEFGYLKRFQIKDYKYLGMKFLIKIETQNIIEFLNFIILKKNFGIMNNINYIKQTKYLFEIIYKGIYSFF